MTTTGLFLLLLILFSANLTMHSAVIGAASAAAALAQEPGSDTAALTAITIAMTAKLCKNYGINGASTFFTSSATCATGYVAGINLATKALTIWPGLGNAANAAITFGLHEATGWALVALCEDLVKKGALDENKKATKELVFDATMQAPYTVLAAYLDDKLQNGADMNNLEISVSELDKSQEKAISAMRYAA